MSRERNGDQLELRDIPSWRKQKCARDAQVCGRSFLSCMIAGIGVGKLVAALDLNNPKQAKLACNQRMLADCPYLWADAIENLRPAANAGLVNFGPACT